MATDPISGTRQSILDQLLEVCRFDVGFLTGLMGTEVEHQSCMRRGGDTCRFRFKPFA